MTLVAVPETAEGVLAKEEVLVRDGGRLMPGQVQDGGHREESPALAWGPDNEVVAAAPSWLGDEQGWQVAAGCCSHHLL